MSDIVVYNSGEIELNISVDKDTIWLTQSQISELFETSIDNVGLHLKNIFKERELDENSTTEDYSVVHRRLRLPHRSEFKRLGQEVVCVF